jgi:uncharacterized membrane protein YhdT
MKEKIALNFDFAIKNNLDLTFEDMAVLDYIIGRSKGYTDRENWFELPTYLTIKALPIVFTGNGNESKKIESAILSKLVKLGIIEKHMYSHLYKHELYRLTEMAKSY